MNIARSEVCSEDFSPHVPTNVALGGTCYV